MKKLLFYGVLIISGFFSNVALPLPINPDKSTMPVVLTDASNPSTYTGTYQNPLNIRVSEGTITSVSTIQQGTITLIDKPIWEAQPIKQNNITFEVTLPPYEGYIFARTWSTTAVFKSPYQMFFEQVSIIRIDDLPIDYCNFEFHTKQSSDYMCLGGEISPLSQTTFTPAIPIFIEVGEDKGYRFIIRNKSKYVQTLKISLLFSFRKVF